MDTRSLASSLRGLFGIADSNVKLIKLPPLQLCTQQESCNGCLSLLSMCYSRLQQVRGEFRYAEDACRNPQSKQREIVFMCRNRCPKSFQNLRGL
ncbi:hypothetical protein SeMB42_g03609 [Synchytrium endobioticum]|uniref:Uncharacterized protein n=1 Tax=Synchytrium endobioticum TaxID=286115 RepID=A0A507D5Y3_9FUNG|nr:hypothetical protein SeMB42_g03609 [Synchytrium endobioticum]